MKPCLFTLFVGAALFLGTALLTLDHATAGQKASSSAAGAGIPFSTEGNEPFAIVGNSSKDRDVLVQSPKDAKDGTFWVRVYDREGTLLFEQRVHRGSGVTVGVPPWGRVEVQDTDAGKDDGVPATGTYTLL